MIIFRFSVMLLSLFLASCGSFPDPSTPLGRIIRINNFAERSKELKRFAEGQLGDSERLKRDFVTAGFVLSRVRNEQGIECERFHWKSEDMFPIVMLVNICGREVFADAGPLAP
jgi:hypothetical protein